MFAVVTSVISFERAHVYFPHEHTIVYNLYSLHDKGILQMRKAKLDNTGIRTVYRTFFVLNVLYIPLVFFSYKKRNDHSTSNSYGWLILRHCIRQPHALYTHAAVTVYRLETRSCFRTKNSPSAQSYCIYDFH